MTEFERSSEALAQNERCFKRATQRASEFLCLLRTMPPNGCAHARPSARSRALCALVRAGIREHKKKITIVMLCALAAGLTVRRTEAECPNETSQTGTPSEQLLAARSKQRAGEYIAARHILQEALSKAPNSASLLNQLGSVQQDLGEYLEAERSYMLALSDSAQTEGERLVILNNLGALYMETGQYAKGEPMRGQLEKFASGTLKGNPAAAAALLNTIGSLAHERNRDDEAENYYARSIQLFRQAEGAVGADAALVESNLAFLRLEAGRYEGAAELFRRSVDEIETVLGSGNPALIRPLVNLARCENMCGHPSEAELVARRAVELSVAVLGERHPVTATAMLEQATALRRLRRKRPARDLEKRAKACVRNNSMTNLSGYTVSVRDLADAAAQ